MMTYTRLDDLVRCEGFEARYDLIPWRAVILWTLAFLFFLRALVSLSGVSGWGTVYLSGLRGEREETRFVATMIPSHSHLKRTVSFPDLF